MKVWLNGKLEDSQQAAVSIFDHGVLYVDGVFEGIRIYGGRVCGLRPVKRLAALPSRTPTATILSHDLQTMDILSGGPGGLDEPPAAGGYRVSHC
jgi:hypothetical protein